MGIVTDERIALEHPCTCYRLEDEELICYSKGIMGTLSDKQERVYCSTMFIRPPTKKLKERHQSFTEAVEEASKRYHGEGINRWLEIVGQELEEKGVKI